MSAPGFTFDTGALIALERGDRRMRSVLKLARSDSVRIVVPTVVLGEWWRGKTKARDLLISTRAKFASAETSRDLREADELVKALN